MVDSVRHRVAARVLPLDPNGRVLLLHGFDPAEPDRPYWFTVGGGLEPEETPAEAAAREMREEVGIAVPPEALGAEVHAETTHFSFDGTAYRQDQVFFAVRLTAADTANLTTDGQEPIEHACIDELRWWSVEELAATGEMVYPEGLVDLLRALPPPS